MDERDWIVTAGGFLCIGFVYFLLWLGARRSDLRYYTRRESRDPTSQKADT
jgi:hypothetical protein